MQLYHFNFGIPAGIISTRETGLHIESLEDWQPPQAGFRERVCYHENLATESDGTVAVKVRNPHFPPAGKPLTLCLSWEARNLPVLVQWKMPGEGTHVLGLEPANCHVEGRAVERESGSLVMLATGQSQEYHLSISLLEE
jgi:hypothetical protein